MNNLLKILFIGDIVGKPGRKTVKELLPEIKNQFEPDIILANAENLAGSLGASIETITEMMDCGIAAFTSGNHIWDKRPFIKDIDNPAYPIVRPANYPKIVPGREYYILELKDHRPLLLINLLGRVFMDELVDCPFQKIDSLLKQFDRQDFSAILVDLHAEATSEKLAMANYLDGRIDILVGTHTHVPTSDTRIFEKGLGYITDVGMVGGYKDAIIGADKVGVLNYFLTSTKMQKWEAGKSDTCFNSVYIEVDIDKHQVIKLERLDRILEKENILKPAEI